MAINILIVDDSGVMRAMIVKTLQMSGIPLGEIHQAANGKEGLDALNRNWIDFAIVDIKMPVMDGEEMIDIIKKNPETRDIPILVISTNESIGKLKSRVSGFVQKPFSPEKIRDIIKEILGLDAENG